MALRENSPTWAVRTQGLTKYYDRQPAVTAIDLAIEEGAVYGLMGPNGAGKTTLLRLLAMAEEPTQGDIFLFGDRLLPGEANLNLKRYLGYLPDDYPLYEELTVGDYLDYFARLYHLPEGHRRRRLQEVLELAQLTSKRNSRIATLSRGMKQRLSLARTIIHEPLLLLLDEPVSGLDPLARQQFRDIIRVLQSAGMTILIASHVLSDLAQLCTAIGIMELGCLVESTDLETLYRQQGQEKISLDLWRSPPETFAACLMGAPGVVDWTVQTMDAQRLTGEITFTGSEADRAALLKALIDGGCQVTNFHTVPQDLEQIFLQLGHQQVS